MSVPVCRFAPSPTGYLHIGGARTALFNWLFARHHGGRFRLRIEDTDRQRSTKEAVDAIINGLRWLELDWDDEVVHQFARARRHAEVAEELLRQGKAYRCYCTPEELEDMRARARAEGRPPRYDGRWRDRDPKDAPAGVAPAIRIKAPQSGETVIRDLVQGDVVIRNDQLDDMILLRGDGTPVYMLSVVVDDFDMGVTHVIRGDDHLNNAARQMMVIEAMGWPVPVYAHIPLIHGPDGAKLSKRHGALAVEAYRDMGYLPEAMRNYLLRLGWSHGDEEIISTAQAVSWFDLDAVGRSAARFDFAKLQNLNAQYLREGDDGALAAAVAERLSQRLGGPMQEAAIARLKAGMSGLKQRAKLLTDLTDSSLIYATDDSPEPDANALTMLTIGHDALAALIPALTASASWSAEALEAVTRDWATASGKKLGEAAQPLRAALAGSLVSPPIFEVMAILGRDLSLKRLSAGLARGG